ncbi:MAG: hypothetical protein V7K76_25265 [Nostoc sp.]|uniref:hypothetical protein n=1 Tax=Nostoc sp. TaxID=1180 RepID=UPI002FF7DFF0
MARSHIHQYLCVGDRFQVRLNPQLMARSHVYQLSYMSDRITFLQSPYKSLEDGAIALFNCRNC